MRSVIPQMKHAEKQTDRSLIQPIMCSLYAIHSNVSYKSNTRASGDLGLTRKIRLKWTLNKYDMSLGWINLAPEKVKKRSLVDYNEVSGFII
jgi:hypothetical protein